MQTCQGQNGEDQDATELALQELMQAIVEQSHDDMWASQCQLPLPRNRNCYQPYDEVLMDLANKIESELEDVGRL